MITEKEIKPPYTIEGLLEYKKVLESELSESRALNETLKQGRAHDKRRNLELEGVNNSLKGENGNLRRRLLVKDQKAVSERLDSLTGLLRRPAFSIALQQLLLVSTRNGSPLTLLFLDIDYFKSVNDQCGGHAVGDRMLKKCAKIIRGSVRESDLVGRWGGEELLIALFDTDLSNGVAYAEKLRRKFEEQLRVIGYGAGKPIHVRRTVSIGIAKFTPGESSEDLIRDADIALYRAKDAGRNMVCI